MPKKVKISQDFSYTSKPFRIQESRKGRVQNQSGARPKTLVMN